MISVHFYLIRLSHDHNRTLLVLLSLCLRILPIPFDQAGLASSSSRLDPNFWIFARARHLCPHAKFLDSSIVHFFACLPVDWWCSVWSVLLQFSSSLVHFCLWLHSFLSAGLHQLWARCQTSHLHRKLETLQTAHVKIFLNSCTPHLPACFVFLCKLFSNLHLVVVCFFLLKKMIPVCDFLAPVHNSPDT